jgi:hypothetical protein
VALKVIIVHACLKFQFSVFIWVPRMRGESCAGQGVSAIPRRRARVSDIKLIRTDTTLDLSQKAEKGMLLFSHPGSYVSNVRL